MASAVHGATLAAGLGQCRSVGPCVVQVLREAGRTGAAQQPLGRPRRRAGTPLTVHARVSARGVDARPAARRQQRARLPGRSPAHLDVVSEVVLVVAAAQELCELWDAREGGGFKRGGARRRAGAHQAAAGRQQRQRHQRGLGEVQKLHGRLATMAGCSLRGGATGGAARGEPVGRLTRRSNTAGAPPRRRAGQGPPRGLHGIPSHAASVTDGRAGLGRRLRTAAPSSGSTPAYPRLLGARRQSQAGLQGPQASFDPPPSPTQRPDCRAAKLKRTGSLLPSQRGVNAAAAVLT